jgi:hypothetical protein
MSSSIPDLSKSNPNISAGADLAGYVVPGSTSQNQPQLPEQAPGYEYDPQPAQEGGAGTGAYAMALADPQTLLILALVAGVVLMRR